MSSLKSHSSLKTNNRIVSALEERATSVKYLT